MNVVEEFLCAVDDWGSAGSGEKREENLVAYVLRVSDLELGEIERILFAEINYRASIGILSPEALQLVENWAEHMMENATDEEVVAALETGYVEETCNGDPASGALMESLMDDILRAAGVNPGSENYSEELKQRYPRLKTLVLVKQLQRQLATLESILMRQITKKASKEEDKDNGLIN
jgi:hypothetical protein